MKFVVELEKELASGIINNLDGHVIPVYFHPTMERIPIGKAIIKKDKYKNIVADIELDSNAKEAKEIADKITLFNFDMSGIAVSYKSLNVIDKFKLTEISISIKGK